MVEEEQSGQEETTETPAEAPAETPTETPAETPEPAAEATVNAPAVKAVEAKPAAADAAEKQKEGEEVEEKEPVIYYLGTGRRKRSVARVRLCDGTGKISINKKEMNEYFKSDHRSKINTIAPL